MRSRAFLLLGLCIACSGCSAETNPAEEPDITVTGRLGDRKIDEASGLVRSMRQDGLYWLINDGGPPRLHPADATGTALGSVAVPDAKHRDWEDIAAFSTNEKPYLLAADIGNNDASRQTLSLYVIAEPDPDAESADVAWQIDFGYPDGPRDAESIAVWDNHIWLLSKRDVPARLYRLDLRPDSDEQQTAAYVGDLASLPQPTPADIVAAPKTKNWFWQPTAMDISADGLAAVVLTYGGVYYYSRAANETWPDAFSRSPRVLVEADFDKAESVAFDPSSEAIYMTFEGEHAKILRIGLPNQ